MRLAAVSTVFNEHDIVAATVNHLLGEGVTDIYVADGMSTDGTRDILRALPVEVYDDHGTYHDQPYWISRLARIAYDDGADWVIPFDADEFWYAPSGQRIFEALGSQPDTINKVHAKTFQHLDYEWREPSEKKLQKVAFRAGPAVQVDPGNHDCTHLNVGADGVLAIREIQYRSFEHFVRKITERNATLDPSLKGKAGWHHTRYEGFTVEQLREEWDAAVARAAVHDPIPVRAYA